VAAGGRQQDELPAYRIVVEAYCRFPGCYLGFLPSHYVCAGAAAAVIPVADDCVISGYGGWYIIIFPAQVGGISDGWTALEPSGGAYATTSEVPPVPAGSAVEFAVDYAAGTCRAAFYTPAAVAGGFLEAPYAKMELRFVATTSTVDDDRTIPARPVPTPTDSGVELYPAVATHDMGSIWRFESELAREGLDIVAHAVLTQ
jgi:hypothetical protein